MIRLAVSVGRLGRDPVGVGELSAVFPRVAEYSNPGLEDASPSGNKSSHNRITVAVITPQANSRVGI